MSFNWKLTMGHLFPPFFHQLWKNIISWMSHHNAGNLTFIFPGFFQSNLVKIGCLNTSNTPQTLVEPSFALGLVFSQHMYLMSQHNAGNSFFFFSNFVVAFEHKPVKMECLNTISTRWQSFSLSFSFLFYFW